MAASCFSSLSLVASPPSSSPASRPENLSSWKPPTAPRSLLTFDPCSSLSSSSSQPSLVLFSSLLGPRPCRNAALAARASDLDLAARVSDLEQEQEQEQELGQGQRQEPEQEQQQHQTEEGEVKSDFEQDPSFQGIKLYVGNLPWSCDSQQLAEVFQDLGSVEMVEVIYDRATGRSRGFGFVTMSTLDDANAAIEKLDGADFGGRTLKVSFPERGNRTSPPRSDRPPRRNSYDSSNKLFVGNLPWGVDDVSLEQMFSEHGKVVEAKVVYDRETGRSRGFGFVSFSTAEEVNDAITALDGADVGGRPLRVNLASERPAARQGFF